MIKKGFVIVICLSVLLLLPGLSKAEKLKFGVKLSGGMSYLAVGDINEGVKSYFDYRKDEVAWMPMPGHSVKGHPKPIHIGLDFEGYITLNLTPKLGIELGSGYIKATRTSEIVFRYPSGYENKATHKPEISAIPIKLGIFYTLFGNERMKVVLNAGAGPYFAKYSYESEPVAAGESSMHQTANGKSLGVHGGVGWELKLAPNISFVLESHARYAKIRNLSGKIRYTGILGYKEEKGTLYYWEAAVPFPNWKNPISFRKYPNVCIRENKPSGLYVSNVRDAKVDFSGLVLMAGIKFNF